MTRRQFAQVTAGAAFGISVASLAGAAESINNTDFFTVVKERRSVRAYSDQAVSDADVETMLRCAMQSPSAANEQPWEFIVIRDKDILSQVGKINPWATYAKDAPVGILVCLNTHKEKEKGMGIIDIGICSENLLLSATALGLGAVFTGIYPYKDRMDGFSKLCALPDYIEPIGLILIGHPRLQGGPKKDYFNPSAIHQNKW